MKRHLRNVTWILWTATAAAGAQEVPSDRVSVAFSDPTRPGTLRASLISGGITVKGYAGKEVVVEARARAGKRGPDTRADGLKRITNVATGLTVEEDANVMKVGAASHSRTIDLVIQVPLKTSLVLKCVNGGDIKVEQVEGDLEVSNTNGAVTLTSISGSAIAHALNENVVVTFVKVQPGKAMSFSSLNGDVDVTFPPDLKANLALKSDQGEIYSDFEIGPDPAARKPVVEDGRGKGGGYRVKIDKTFYGSVNGGGPEMSFKTFNGDIFIRKAK